MTTTLAKMDRSALRAAARTLGLTGVTEYSVPALRTWISEKTGTEIDAEFTPPVRTLDKTTEPLRKAHQPRVASIPYGSRLNRHYNDDGSITLYARGVKVFRTLATEGDDVEVDEDYDGEAEVEKFARRWFGTAPALWGKTTHSHNWKNRAKKEDK